MAQLGQRTLADTAQQHVDDHNQLHSKANYVFDVTDFGAVGDGVTDDSAAIQTAMDAAAGGVCFMPPATYRANGLNLPTSTELAAEQATIERHAPSGTPVLTVADDCYVHGLTVSGRNKTVVGQSGEQGIRVEGDNTLIERCTATLNWSHGLYAQADNVHFDKCVGHTNGENAGPGGTGDGIFLVNCNEGMVTDCQGYGNARSGIVATTFDASQAIDPTWSKHVLCDNSVCYENAYAQTNFEGVSFAKITNLTIPGIDGGGLSVSASTDCQVENLTGTFYAQESDRITVDGVETRVTDTSSAFFLSGLRPKVTNVRIVGSGGSYTSNAFEVLDTTDYAGLIANITVDYCNNGVIIDGVSDVSNIQITNASGIAWRIGRAGGTGTRSTNLIDVTNNKITCSSSVVPSNGWWDVGDICYDTGVTAGGTMGSVCTTAGSPGTWKTFGAVTA